MVSYCNMYILKTTIGDSIKIDADELAKINESKPDQLILFRQGAVLKRMIALIIEDPEGERDGPRELGTNKTKPKLQDDIFPQLRGPQQKKLT
jgi:hypothetical protein